jgi:hypothetical protein
MNSPKYTARELAFIAEALGRLARRLNTCGLPVAIRDEVASAMDEYLARKVSDLATRYPSGATFVDAVFATRCIDALRTWRAQRGEGARGERIVEMFDAAVADTHADMRLPDPLDLSLAQLEASLINRLGLRKGRLTFRVKVLGDDTTEAANEFGISRTRAAHLISQALRELGDDDGFTGSWSA